MELTALAPIVRTVHQCVGIFASCKAQAGRRYRPPDL